jgi:quinol monooxygenase YgiN
VRAVPPERADARRRGPSSATWADDGAAVTSSSRFRPNASARQPQPGCLRYSFAATLADPDRFVLVREWGNKVAMDAQYGSQAFANLQFPLDGLLARPGAMTVYSITGSARRMDPRDGD